MARRSTPRSTSTGRKSSFYPDDVLDRVIEAAGGLPEDEVEVAVHFGGVELSRRVSRREKLRERLETAALSYTLSYTLLAASVREPTSAMLAKACADVEVPAEKMLRALLRPGTGRSQLKRSLYSALEEEIEFLFGRDPFDESSLAKALQYLWMVHRSARVLRIRYERMGKTPRSKRHIGDVHLNDLFRALLYAWIFDFERIPATSTKSPSKNSEDDGAATGPLIAFIRAALEPVLEDVPSDDAIRPRVRRLLRGFRRRRNMAELALNRG